MIYCSRCRALVCAESGLFTTVPCLNRKSMRHFVREGGNSLESLPSGQSLGAQTNKGHITTLQPGEGRKPSPLSCPQSLHSKVSGDSPWPLDKACPIVTLSMPTFPLPVPPDQLSTTGSEHRRGRLQRRGVWPGQKQRTDANPPPPHTHTRLPRSGGGSQARGFVGN